MNTGDTIVALATNPAPAPRAMVRISGDLSPISPLFSEPLRDSRGAQTLAIRLRGGSGAMFPVLVARFAAPASYTGEEALEISFAGGPAISARLIETLTQAPGVRQAEPGEFTARAYLNGRIGIDRAQGVAALIAAEDRAQLQAASRIMDASLGDAAKRWSDQLSTLLALVEAGIDFADQEDVVAIAPAELLARLDGLYGDIKKNMITCEGGELLSVEARVVMVGAPSAGKSTLFNALLGWSRSVVDADPGTTRDAIVEPLPLPGGAMIELVDLAGLDDHGVSDVVGVGAQIRDRAMDEIQRADAVLLCDPDSRFDAVRLPAKPTLRVRTMADRPFSGEDPADLAVCALDGWHLDDLRSALAELVGRTGPDGGGAIAARFAAGLEQCLQGIDSARSLLRAGRGGAPWELVAGELRRALDGLGVLGGKVDPDEVLGLIFRTFCVGK